MNKHHQENLEQISKQLNDWTDILKNNPLWYKTVEPTLIEWEKQYSENPNKDKAKELVYSYFQSKLDKEEILLAKEGPNLEIGKKKIDTAEIHHPPSPPG